MAKGNRLTPGSKTPFVDFANDAHNFAARKIGRGARAVGRGVSLATGGAVSAFQRSRKKAKKNRAAVGGAIRRFEKRLWGGRNQPINRQGVDNSGGGFGNIGRKS